jgi:hypothetical protein
MHKKCPELPLLMVSAFSAHLSIKKLKKHFSGNYRKTLDDVVGE